MRPDSFKAKVIEFFERNPDEELTVKDAEIKFPEGSNRARENLKELHDLGLVGRRWEVVEGSGKFVYTRA